MHTEHTARGSLLFEIALLLFLASPALSQPGPPPIDRRTNPDRARQQDMSKREWQLRNFGNEPGKPPDRRQLEALMAQTEEDFNRILILHNEFARAISSKQNLDYEFLSDATTEIRKRATRLQTTLLLRQPTKESVHTKQTEPAINDAQLRDELIGLCKHIKNFVTSPVIQTPNTVNAEELAKARTELESLIQLSGKIKKDADELKKMHKH